MFKWTRALLRECTAHGSGAPGRCGGVPNPSPKNKQSVRRLKVAWRRERRGCSFYYASSTESPVYVKTCLSFSSTVSISCSVPIAIRKQPSHPGSFPLNRTTTPIVSASVLYTVCARPLSGFRVLTSNIGTMTKFASGAPMGSPTPSSGKGAEVNERTKAARVARRV